MRDPIAMTAQYPDSIRYKRRFHNLCSEPLEAYFSERRLKPEMFATSCTACWRGYRAIWAIRHGRLYLDWISPWPWPGRGSAAATKAESEELFQRSLSAIFPGATAPVFAEWFSGELGLWPRKFLRDVLLGYEWLSECEVVLLVERGRVIGEKPKENEPAGGYEIPSFLRKTPLP